MMLNYLTVLLLFFSQMACAQPLDRKGEISADEIYKSLGLRVPDSLVCWHDPDAVRDPGAVRAIFEVYCSNLDGLRLILRTERSSLINWTAAIDTVPASDWWSPDGVTSLPEGFKWPSNPILTWHFDQDFREFLCAHSIAKKPAALGSAAQMIACLTAVKWQTGEMSGLWIEIFDEKTRIAEENWHLSRTDEILFEIRVSHLITQIYLQW